MVQVVHAVKVAVRPHSSRLPGHNLERKNDWRDNLVVALIKAVRRRGEKLAVGLIGVGGEYIVADRREKGGYVTDRHKRD